jgi:hypothetical protein
LILMERIKMIKKIEENIKKYEFQLQSLETFILAYSKNLKEALEKEDFNQLKTWSDLLSQSYIDKRHWNATLKMLRELI